MFSLFIWIEKLPNSTEKNIQKSNLNGTNVEQFIYFGNNNCNCSDLYPSDIVITSYVSNSGKMKILWIEGNHRNIIVSDVDGCKCSIVFSTNSTRNLTSLAIDKYNIYWTTNKSMCSIKIIEFNDIPTIKNDASLYCLNNVTAVYSIDGLPDLSKL